MSDRVLAKTTYWKGAITFGLVTVPVKLYIAASSRDVGFNTVHLADMQPVGVKTYCKGDGELIPDRDQTGRAYRMAKDEYVLVTDDEIAALETAKGGQAIDVVQFVDASKLDPLMFEKAYYVEPEDVGQKAYALLRTAMEQENVVALCRVVMRNKDHLAIVRPTDGMLMVHLLFWPDEVREPAFRIDAVELADQELGMARLLVQSLTESDLDLSGFRDEYREALLAFIEAKADGQAPPDVEQVRRPEVADLMDALRASVAAARDAKKEDVA